MFNLIPLIMSMFIATPPQKPALPYVSPVSITREWVRVVKQPRATVANGSSSGTIDEAADSGVSNGFDGAAMNNNGYDASNDNNTLDNSAINGGNNFTENSDNYYENDTGYDFSDYASRKDELDQKYSKRKELREKIIGSIADVIEYYEEYNQLSCSYRKELRQIIGGKTEDRDERPTPKPAPEPVPIPEQDPVDPTHDNGDIVTPDGEVNYSLS